MEIDWVQVITTFFAGGSVVYLAIEKVFARKQDNAVAHGTMVASFDQEMESLRKIRLDMINDVQDMRDQYKAEKEKTSKSISGEVESLRNQIAEEHDVAKQRDELFTKQIGILNVTVQKQADQINKMTMYWQLLCDVDCNNRHVPKCPLSKLNTDGKTETV